LGSVAPLVRACHLYVIPASRLLFAKTLTQLAPDTLGTLFAKIRRVYLTFQRAATHRNASSVINTPTTSSNSNSYNNTFNASRNAAHVSFRETLLVIGVVTLVDVGILVAWTVVDPLKWERVVLQADKFGVSLESQGYWYSDSWEVFAILICCLQLFLLTIACVLCYKAREIPTMFSEGRYLCIAMVSNLQILIVGGEFVACALKGRNLIHHTKPNFLSPIFFSPNSHHCGNGFRCFFCPRDNGVDERPCRRSPHLW
jgi:hypothetical protein